MTNGRKMEYDLEYVRTRSFMADMRILAKTVVCTLLGKGAV